MKAELKKQIIDTLEKYMSEHGLTQEYVCDMAGVSGSYMIQMRKGVYELSVGNRQVQIADKYFARIAEFIGFDEEKSIWQTQATVQLKQIFSALQDAQQNAETRVITGETGCGKSYCCDIFRKQRPAEVFIIVCSNSDSLRDLIEKTLDALGNKTHVTGRSRGLRLIIDELKRMCEAGKEPVLIYDEAEFMKLPTLCAMKELYEGLRKRCGLVLIGTEQLATNIERMRLKKRLGMPQFARRVKFYTRRLSEIDRRFTMFLNGFGSDLKKWLQNNCDNYGELHDVLVPALREAERTGATLTEDFVKMTLGLI